MNDMKCPFCHASVPHGATVCRGCQAEVEYGPPQAAIIGVLLLAAFAGWFIGSSTHAIAGWITLVILAVAGVIGCAKIFKNRVNFKRLSTTR